MEEDESEATETMPQRKKRPLPPTIPPPNPEQDRCNLIWKIVVSVIFFGGIFSLLIFSSGDRPLAVAIRNYMGHSKESLSSMFSSTPDNSTDAFGDSNLEDHDKYRKLPPPIHKYSPRVTAVPTPKPSAANAVPAASFTYGNYAYDLYSQPWTFANATLICKTRSRGNLIYFDSKEEFWRVNNWTILGVKEGTRLSFKKAGYFYTAGFRQQGLGYPFCNETVYMTDWNWDLGARGLKPAPSFDASQFQPMCRDCLKDIPKEAWEEYKGNKENMRRLRLVMDFKKINWRDPQMGCWKWQYPLEEEQINDLTGMPFICKREL